MDTISILKAVAAIILSGAFMSAHAIPAKPGLLTVRQIDGTTVPVHLVGDERAHMYTTPDGYPLVSVGGIFYYAAFDGSTLAGTTMRNAVRQRPTNIRAFIPMQPSPSKAHPKPW